MRQARVIVALLLPVFWLAMAVGSFFEPAWLTGEEACCQAHASATAQPQEYSGQPSTLEAVSLSPARRHRPESALSLPAVQVLFKLVPLARPAENCAPQTVAVLSLARTWQFRLRAALNPRAPSCLS